MVLSVYKMTSSFPSSEKFQLISQMKRAAYSIPSNFSEGCGRDSDKDFNRFIQICLGSAHELEYFFILSKELGFIEEPHFEIATKDINEIKRKLYKLSLKLKAYRTSIQPKA